MLYSRFLFEAILLEAYNASQGHSFWRSASKDANIPVKEDGKSFIEWKTKLLLGAHIILSKLDDILDPFEKVIWSGKPKKIAYILPAFGFILFALVFASAFAVIVNAANPSGMFWILPIVIGLVIGFIPVLWQSKKSPSVEYMITNQRLLIKSGMAKEDVWFTDLNRIKESIVKIGLVDKIVGTGKLYPITPEYPYAPKMRSYSRAGMDRLKKVYNIVEGKDEMVSETVLFSKSVSHPHLEGLEEPYSVQKLLKEAISAK